MAKAVKKKAVVKKTARRKIWEEKMLPGREAEVKKNAFDFADIPAGRRMLIATPLIVDAYIRKIPKGHFTGIRQMRKDLAAEFNAEYTCPVTTGIFLRIVAEHAYEQYKKGKALQKITPFWRAMSSKSPSAKKLTFGTGFLVAQQQKEGIVEN